MFLEIILPIPLSFLLCDDEFLEGDFWIPPLKLQV